MIFAGARNIWDSERDTELAVIGVTELEVRANTDLISKTVMSGVMVVRLHRAIFLVRLFSRLYRYNCSNEA